MEKLIKRGAEAEIYLSKWLGREVIIKRRIKKKYRIKELDDVIREQRTKREALLMMAARSAGVSVPIIYDVNLDRKEIVMQYIKGNRIKDFIDKMDEKNQKKICKKIGRSIANMHKNGIIHGDITTSNMIIENETLYFIDFGLGMKSEENEDRGVDMHLLMEAFNAVHKNRKLFKWVFEEYEKNFDEGEEIRKKINEIIRRGRYMRQVT